VTLETFWIESVHANLNIGPPWNTRAMHAWLDWIKRSVERTASGSKNKPETPAFSQRTPPLKL